jgi:hypothetical protein
MSNIELNLNGNGNISIFGQGSEINILPNSITMSPQSNNLIYLFDPLYYKGYETLNTYNKTYHNSFLKKIFNQYESILPASTYVFSNGKILNKKDDPDNLQRKGGISGSFFSYEKYNDDSDVSISRSKSRPYNKASMVKERTRALLQLKDPSNSNTFNFLQENTSKTFSFFIRLNSPVKHKSSKSFKVIREKKGIFLNTGQISVGYKSPFYLVKPSPRQPFFRILYKYKFEPFSFVFSIQDNAANHTFMTDFKYQFGKTYHVSITIESGSKNPSNYNQIPATVKLYINGEQQNTAYLEFNPLIQGNKASKTNASLGSRLKSSRDSVSPAGPGFKMKNGAIYSPIANQHNIQYKLGNNPGNNSGNRKGSIGWKTIYLGKSNIEDGRAKFNINPPIRVIPIYPSRSRIKRYLNNIDIGVIHIYKSILSQLEIFEIYKNFSNRY